MNYAQRSFSCFQPPQQSDTKIDFFRLQITNPFLKERIYKTIHYWRVHTHFYSIVTGILSTKNSTRGFVCQTVSWDFFSGRPWAHVTNAITATYLSWWTTLEQSFFFTIKHNRRLKRLSPEWEWRARGIQLENFSLLLSSMPLSCSKRACLNLIEWRGPFMTICSDDSKSTLHDVSKPKSMPSINRATGHCQSWTINGFLQTPILLLWLIILTSNDHLSWGEFRHCCNHPSPICGICFRTRVVSSYRAQCVRVLEFVTAL